MGHDLSREKEGGWGKDERANQRPCFEMSRGGGDEVRWRERWGI